MAMKIKTNHPFAVALSLLLGLTLTISLVANEVAEISGTSSFKIDAGASVAVPKYKVGSAGVAGDPVYEGSVASVSGDVLTFETSTDSDGVTTNPFVPGTLASGVVRLKAAISGGAISGLTDEDGDPISGTNTEGSSLDDANPPIITIGDPDTGDDVATATATVSGGKVTGITITNAGSGYTTVPEVTVECGPYVVRLTESGSNNLGRSFIVTSNTATTVTVSNPNSETLSNIFETDFEVEVVRATTLGDLFGVDSTNLASGTPNTADFVYLWDVDSAFFTPYFHFGGNGSFAKGWYRRTNIRAGVLNDTVIYPDEGFIVARRSNPQLVLEFDGDVVSTDQQMQLPPSGKQFVMNNPFGTGILLTELLSPVDIGTGNNQFKPATDGSGDTGDNVYLLTGAVWEKYWYKAGVNVGVTKVATASAKAPAGGTMSTSDVSLDSGTVTGLASCDSSGNTAGVDHNTSEYTKVTLSGSAPAAGFTITFSDVRGQKINDNGDMEVDLDGDDVNPGSGINIQSALNGSFLVVASSGSTVVVKKRRNVNFVSTGSTPTWSTGDGGGGYSSAADVKVYFLGGGGSGGEGTATVAGGKISGITVTTPGSGYAYAPQVVIGGGGWRKEGAADTIQDGELVDGSTGILLIRNHPTGVLTYIKADNPTN